MPMRAGSRRRTVSRSPAVHGLGRWASGGCFKQPPDSSPALVAGDRRCPCCEIKGSWHPGAYLNIRAVLVVSRRPASQAGRRGFESLLPLHVFNDLTAATALPVWLLLE